MFISTLNKRKKRKTSPENFLEMRRVFLDEAKNTVVLPDVMDMLPQDEMDANTLDRKEKLHIQGSLRFLQDGITKQQRLDIGRTANLHEVFRILTKESGSNRSVRKQVFIENQAKIIEFAKIPPHPFNTYEQKVLENNSKYEGTLLQNIALTKWIKSEISHSFHAQDKKLIEESTNEENAHTEGWYEKTKSGSEKNPEIFRPNDALSGKTSQFISESQSYVASKITFNKGKRIEEKIKRDKQKDIPYTWGGTDLSKGVDCSGFVQALLLKQGIRIPRISNTQAKHGEKVAKEDLIPGDLVFFLTDKSRGVPVTHVAIYIGKKNGKDMMVHAASTTLGIIESELNSPYYKNKFVTARRYIKEENT